MSKYFWWIGNETQIESFPVSLLFWLVFLGKWENAGTRKILFYISIDRVALWFEARIKRLLFILFEDFLLKKKRFSRAELESFWPGLSAAPGRFLIENSTKRWEIETEVSLIRLFCQPSPPAISRLIERLEFEIFSLRECKVGFWYDASRKLASPPGEPW